MKNKLLTVSVITLVLLMLLQVVAFAAIEKLTLKVSTDKDFYSVGDTVTVTVDWTEQVESAGFDVKYDASKLTFVKATDANGNALLEDFYNGDVAGTVTFNWFAMAGKASKMLFVFTVEAEGEATISVESPRGFGYTDNGALTQIKNENVTISGSKKVSLVPKVEEKPPVEEQKPVEQQKPVEEQKPVEQQKPTTNTNKDNTTASGKMPQTGAETTTILAIVALAVLGTAGFVGYRRLSDI